ncbi:MAG: ATP-binding cassette domain-containing protein [Oscillospiraceae bacterium]|nr:ATP-binding cassette domain-containing protein [Oscillospiraceae bacterium]
MSLFVDIRKKLGDFHLDVRFETTDNVLGLLGASGSGKSMTLKCIAGIEKPDAGKIVLHGVTLFDSEKRINLPPQKRNVGYLFQSYALFPNMNVRQNILCGLHGEKDKAVKERILAELLEMTQLQGFDKHRPHELSGGQQQRGALARILAGSPNLLMLDEPFSALDSQLRARLQVEMREMLKKFGKSVLMVTHDRTEAYRLCHQIALVDDGKILTQKNTKTLFADPESREAALMTGCKNIMDAEKTGEYELFVPAWGIHLTTALPLRDGLTAVGVRAHYFNAKTSHNRYPVRFVELIEEPFEHIFQFRYEGQAENTPTLWWHLPKDRMPREPYEVGIAPQNVLPLYGAGGR